MQIQLQYKEPVEGFLHPGILGDLDGVSGPWALPEEPMPEFGVLPFREQLFPDSKDGFGVEESVNGVGSFFGDWLSFVDKQYNGGLNNLSVGVEGYNRLPNDVKRRYA